MKRLPVVEQTEAASALAEKRITTAILTTQEKESEQHREAFRELDWKPSVVFRLRMNLRKRLKTAHWKDKRRTVASPSTIVYFCWWGRGSYSEVRGSIMFSAVNYYRDLNWVSITEVLLAASLIPLLPFKVKALKDSWILLRPCEALARKSCSLVIAPNWLVMRSTEAGT